MEFDWSPVLSNASFLIGGLELTLLLSLCSVILSLMLGTVIGLARCYGPRPLQLAIAFYVDSMRAIPVLVVLVWTYFALPILTGAVLPPFWAALVALTVHIAAYVAEIVRAGVSSIRRGQLWAASALGMSLWQSLRTVILPQAVVRMLPAFGSVISIAIKDTAIASVIAVPEYMNRSQTVAGQSFHPIEIFTVAVAVYFLILFPVTRLVDFVYGRLAHLGRS
ncbi:MAG TPA: amino acid ABC transporter permease [Bradyrhizobium sp.]|uniref:amino acid ABC transporter permease n=1 Tax=Bradyrhizobium sp. TaxID=376 RepID=UPI002D7FFCED|nr:amino acid ABC transporter permease [Bradyrhizobium sp.]HET7888878.1 amino acid ABC transporter permease [Bradyrhizobium sp.]